MYYISYYKPGTHSSRRCCDEQVLSSRRIYSRGEKLDNKQGNKLTRLFQIMIRKSALGALVTVAYTIAQTKQDAVVERWWHDLRSCDQEGLFVGPHLGKT